MCFGGNPKMPDVQPPPPVSPPPSPSAPTEVASQTAEQRANKINQLRYGILSTIKTGAAGISGAGPDLSAPVAGAGQKKALGA